MDLFDHPHLLSNHVKELDRAVAHWQRGLQVGEIDETGPFIGRPAMTERDSFRVIRESREPDPVKRAYLRWTYRLSEARVNARLWAAMAEAYRMARHRIEYPEPLDLSLAELLHRTLSRPKERLIWLEALASNASWLQRLAVEWIVRQDEIAKRAGFSDIDDASAPTKDLTGLVERMLAATEDCYRDLVPKEPDRWLDAALGVAAQRGWPAQLYPRTVQALLGTPEWLEGLELEPRGLPSPIAATSFARALYELGAAMARAAVPKQELFVLGQDPYQLNQHTLGALLAGLTASDIWQKQALLLAPAQAREQSRVLRLSQLIHARTTALAWLLRQSARAGVDSVTKQFEELSHRTLGFALPAHLAAVLPRLRIDSGQRLVGLWLSARWTRELTLDFDEDWFRNPRGIEAVRARMAQGFPSEVEPNELSQCIDVFAAELRQSL